MPSEPHTPRRKESHARDLELVRGVLSGSTGSLDELTDRLRCVPRMLKAQNARLGSPLRDDELEDLTQDTLVALWRRLDTFAGHATLETWACGYCRRELAGRLRSRARHESRREAEMPERAGPGIESALEWEHLHRALERIGPPEADVLRLKHFEALTFDEMGARLAVSPNTLKAQYYRGLERLRELLAGLHEEVRS